MRYRNCRKYRKYSKTKRKPKLKIRGRGVFGSTLKNFATQWYCAVGERWEEKIYVMMKLATPKRVTLPNGRTFLASYKRVKRTELPSNIIMRRNYTQRAPPRGN